MNITPTIQKVLPAEASFLPAVQSVSQYLGIQPEWLLVVMYNESRLNPYAKNSSSGAYGLIQFMPGTMSSMGISESILRNKTATQQMQYVQQYFAPYRGRMLNVYDVYAAVFFPVMIGKPDSFVLATASLSASVVAKANPIFDLDKNLQITKAEFIQYIKDKLLPLTGTIVATTSIMGFLLVGLGIFLIVKRKKKHGKISNS
jgi:LPXTG-motif cell wall-anchored protein